MPEAFLILLGFLVTVISSLAAGKLVLRRLALPLSREEEHLFAFVVGAACLSTIVFALAAMRVVHAGVFLTVTLILVVAALQTQAHKPRGEALPPLPRAWRVLFLGVFAVYTVLYFFNAMAPEMSHDGMSYHLGGVARIYRNQGFERVTTNMYANLSGGLEMLFLFAYAFGRHSAAALVHFGFLLALPLLLLCYGRRFGFPEAGIVAALFFFLSPMAGVTGTSAYVDVAVACVLFAVFYLLRIWEETRSAGILVPVGLLAGFCYAIKYTAFTALPYALSLVVWKLARARERMLPGLAVIAICAAAMMTPWLAKNWIWAGNPFSPFLNSFFPSPYITIQFERDYGAVMRQYSVAGIAEIPSQVTVLGDKLGGVLGPLFLLAPLALAAAGSAHGRQILLAAAVFAATYPLNIGTRFLLPCLPFMCLALALVLLRWRPIAVALVLVHAIASWPSIVKAYAPLAWRLERIPLRAALRIEPEDSYLNFRSHAYGTARMIETMTPPDAKVFSWTGTAEAYTSREILVSFQSAFGLKLRDIIYTPLADVSQPQRRVTFRFSERSVRNVRLVQTARSASQQWRIIELHVRRGEQEIARDARWRLSTHPFPWDVELAFDRNPVTRWQSGQALFPGMHFEIDFGGTTRLDAIALDTGFDQYDARLRLEGSDDSGQWVTLAEAAEESRIDAPRNLRRIAMDTLKGYGVGYLFIDQGDFGYEDLRDNAARWGITMIAKRGTARLYRLD